MEIVIGLVVLAFVGLGLFGVFGLGFMGWISSGAEKAKQQAPQILDELFDGTPHVTYRIHMQALPFETVVLGGEERGYTLTHDTDERGVKLLMFKLTDPSEVPARPAPVDHEVGPADRSGAWIMALGGGIALGGLFLAIALPPIAAIGYLAAFAGVALLIYGARERAHARREAGQALR